MKALSLKSEPVAKSAAANSAEKHIRHQLKGKKTLSIRERKIVARNIHNILERAKSEGVKTKEVAAQMHLGQGESKDLHPFYLPPDKSERRLIAKPDGYIKLVEALSSIQGHSRTGATSDLLREAFSNTQYWDRSAYEEDVVLDLFAIIKECEAWLLRDGEVAEAYKRLERLSRPKEMLTRVEDLAITIYRMAFEYPRSLTTLDLEPPRFYIGSVCSPILNLSREAVFFDFTGSGIFGKSLRHSREFYLYLGPDEVGEIRLQVVEEKALTIGSGNLYDRGRVKLIDDRFEGDGIVFQTYCGESVNLVGDEFRTIVGEPGELLGKNKYRSLTDAFIAKHPDIKLFGYEYGMPEEVDEVELYPMSMDLLDHIKEVFSINDCNFLSPNLDDVQQPDLQLRYGACRLTQLLTFFLYPWISEMQISRYEMAKHFEILENKQPSGGWVHPDGLPDDRDEMSYWAIPDLLWIQSKLFCRIIDQGYEEAAKAATERLASTLNKFSEP